VLLRNSNINVVYRATVSCTVVIAMRGELQEGVCLAWSDDVM
jgi:hypothetical protein